MVGHPVSHRISVLRATQDTSADIRPYVRDFHPLRSAFPDCSTSATVNVMKSYNPDVHVHRFGLLRFRSPLLAESSLFLGLIRCFSSPGSLPFTDIRV